MKIPIFLLCSLLLICPIAGAQTAVPAADPIPGLGDFPEFQKLISEVSFEEASRLNGLDEGSLLLAVGFEKYARRTFSTGASGDISVAAATLLDFRAAYSMLTMRGGSVIRQGPPGDAYAADASGIRFFQGKRWIRIDGSSASPDLLKRIALFVSDRLGSRRQKPPSIVRELPRAGCDAASVRYFPNVKTFETYAGLRAFRSMRLDFDAEIAQARYSLNNQAGSLTVLNFPTPEVGEEYFNERSTALPDSAHKEKTYLKRAGPLVAVLSGDTDSRTADTILAPISHSYAVRWIFEKPKNKGIAWGIPVRILHTVAKSALFVMFLCIVAVFVGAGLAWFLLARRRRRASKKPPDWLGQTDSTRLR